MPTLLQPSVMPSGESIVLHATDSTTGRDTYFTGMSDNNEVQSLFLTARPTGGTFTLSWGGSTTAPIPTFAAPPARYGMWNKAITPGVYDLAANKRTGQSGPISQLYEVFDGPVVSTSLPMATAVLNHHTDSGTPANPSPFTDAGVNQPGGAPVQWYSLGRFTFAGTEMHVRCSCDADPVSNLARFDMADLRYVPVAGTPINHVQPNDLDGSLTVVAPGFDYGVGAARNPQFYQVGTDTANALEVDGLGAGVRTLADPAVVRAALEALPSVGVGNVSVTGDSSPLNPLLIKFVGTLGSAPQPLIAAADPVIHIARVTAGDTFPALQINGVALPVQVRWAYMHNNAAMPTVEFFLPQAPPARVDLNANTYLGTYSNGSDGAWDHTSIPGFGPYGPLITPGSTPTMTWRYAPLKASTIRISVIWTASGVLSTSVTFTVKTYNAGTTLGTHTVNQTLAPSGTPDGAGHTFEVIGSFAVADGDGFVVVQSNGTAAHMIADTLRFERTSADDSIRIAPTDVVTATWGAGWATCQAGPVPAAPTPVPATNLVGGTIYPPLPTSTTMKIGWNLGYPDGAQSYLFFQNMAEHGYYYGGPFTTATSPYVDIDFTFTPQANGANNLSWPNFPNGPWTLLWAGASVLTPQTRGAGTVTINSTTAHRVDFTTAGGWNSHGASMSIRVDSTGGTAGAYTYDFTNIRILPGGSDLVSPPRFRADFLDTISHGASVRHLNTTAAIGGNGTDPADFHETRVSKAQIVRAVQAGFARIEAYTGSDFGFPLSGNARYTLLKITTPTPHGLSTGQYVNFTYSGPDLILTNPVPAPPDWPSPKPINLSGRDGMIWVLNATQVVAMPFILLNPGYTMSNVLVNPDPAGFIRMQVVTLAVEDICTLANLTGSSPCVPLPFSITDAALDDIGAFFATHLDPGIPLRVQCSNEVWNFGISPPYSFSIASTSLYYGGDGGYYITYYVERAQLMWNRMKAAFLAAGGDPALFVRVMDGQHAGSGYTAQIFGLMHDKGYTCDEFSVAPYFENEPAVTQGGAGAISNAVPALVDSLTVAQHLDMLELHYTYGGYDGEYRVHHDAMVGLQPGGTMLYPEFAAVRMISYEGGQEHLDLRGGTGINAARTAHGMVRHPRYYGIQLHHFRTYQDSGCTLFQIFQTSGSDAPDGTAWSNFQYTGQQPYIPGDPAQDAIQINDFDNLPLVKSVAGGAVRAWNSLLGVTPVPDFSLTASPVTIPVGQFASLVATLVPTGGYAGHAVLGTTGLPAGVTAGPWVPTGLDGTGTHTATQLLTVAPGAAAGPTTLTITATDAPNGLVHSRSVVLTVTSTTPTPNFTLTATGPVTITRGLTATSTIVLAATNGYIGTAALALAGLPLGVTLVSFVPTSVTGGGANASTLTLAASGTAMIGAVTVTVTGTDAANSLTHTATFALTVVASGGVTSPVAIRDFRWIRVG